MTNLEDRIINAVVELLRIVETKLPSDVLEALKQAASIEESPFAKAQFEAILKNAEVASKESIPMCQDTGLIGFYVKLGDDFPIRSKLNDLLIEAVRRATQEIPLRPNTIDPWTHKNPGDNTGRHIPFIHIELVPGDELEITVMPKGGGSSYVAQFYSVPPVEGIKGLKRVVLEAIYKIGPLPCPPVIVGIGVGGTEDLAMFLAKKALLRPINKRNENPEIAKLEEELREKINSLGIGPMGLGGKSYALGVNIEWAHRHPATFLVGIAIGCWAMRRGTLRISKDGEAEIISHGVKL